MDSNKYIKTPSSISYKDIGNVDYTLSASQYKHLSMLNTNTLTVRDFLSRPLQRKDLGVEVGSLNYINQSTHYFLRTKALQEHSLLPDITKETMLPIMPQSFVQMNLKEGDLIISKDSNIGEIVILDRDYPNVMLSSALYKLPINCNKYYLLAFIKHSLFREQLDVMVPKGATIRHAKKLFLNCKIPLPNKNKENTIKFIEFLTSAIINKERRIKERYNHILDLIDQELYNNQKLDKFIYDFPFFDELVLSGRLDTKTYTKEFKENEYIVKNYNKGAQTIYELGFKLSRGQNLQVSNIGGSIYCKTHHKDFYTLVLPKFLSKYGTIEKVEYLGNPNSLKTLKRGDLIFGAEGFEKGRSIVVLEEEDNVITNIHGITFKQEAYDINKAIFVKCFLDYLRNKGIIDLYAVGGNGGSLAQKYWDVILFPKFPKKKQDEIVRLYHNLQANYDADNFTLNNFLELDNAYNEEAGIYELGKTAKMLNEILNTAIDNIANDKEVNVKFSI